MWAPNGRELFYQNGNSMMAVDVELSPAFKAGTPRVLFEMPLAETPPMIRAAPGYRAASSMSTCRK